MGKSVTCILHTFRLKRTNGDRPLHPSRVTTVHGPAADRALRGATRLRYWERLSHGLYVPRGSRPLAVDLAAWQLVLPESACFTSLSSAELRGWWQPARVSHPVFVSVLSDAAHPQRRGLSVSRHPRPVDFETIDEIRVASAAETLLAVAKDLGVIDLVIIGDSALHQGACTIDQLSTAAAGRRRGAPQLRKVIPILDGRSESPWESILRLPISGWLEQVGCTSMTARCIAIETHIARIWRESAAWSRSTGSASVSRHRSCSTKEARSSPA